MGGSGGGAAGKVAYPTYIESIQADWLANCGVLGEGSGRDTMSYSVTDGLTDAIGNSPFSGGTAFDPDTRITSWETEIGAFETLVEALAETTDWAALLTQAVTSVGTNFVSTTPVGDTSGWLDPTPAADAEISADVDAYEAVVDDHVETDVLPRFQRGMQDINAVMTSAFTIGQAIIEGMADRDVAKYQGSLRVAAYMQKDKIVADSKLKESERVVDLAKQVDDISLKSNTDKNRMYIVGVEQMLRYFLARLSAEEAYSKLYVSGQMAAVEAQRSETETQSEIDEADATWDLTVFQYGANVMAGASGGTAIPLRRPGPTRAQSMIGGAMSGAAMGTMINPGIGTAAGAGLGAIAGYFGGQ